MQSSQSKSKFETSGSATIYLYKFMRRGNIRMGCSKNGYYMETAGKPSPGQMETLARIAGIAAARGIETYLMVTDGHGNGKTYDLGLYLDHVLDSAA